ncbi:hypothetical protein JYT78_00555 [bacterium AH-315-I20]|nr:hypothetical protein [bacterium AH-315-I20]
MFGISTQFFSRSKAAGQRISGLVLSVFMLQVIAAGFCVPTVSAAPVSQASNMEHCMGSTMNMDEMNMMDESVVTHACAHCDLPDVSVSFDKHDVDNVSFAADFVVVAIVPTALDVETATFVVSPPDLQTHYTSLSTYNLNLRIRV